MNLKQILAGLSILSLFISGGLATEGELDSAVCFFLQFIILLIWAFWED